ncbi:MAG: hypothetical protein LBJ15_05075 [Comamonas sp.]|jgi:hypothetical protein|uniref:hypothetical protein n=1 Tax=Comamonas sp. TaxID=34028 RepID=UPI002833212B|nr:hypothetical protein [Comamonas sp.]MDR0213363.1 hypothetical protein [Comamonas sp.]
MRTSSRYVLTSVCIAALTACDGGGGSGSSAPDNGSNTAKDATVQTFNIGGAAFTGATVTVTDATGKEVGTCGPVKDDGKCDITIPASANAKAPLIIVASRTVNGEAERLVSMLGDVTSTEVKVTPITTLIAALLSPSGNPGNLASEVAGGTAVVTPAAIQAQADKVQTILAPLLEAAGVKNENPLAGGFVPDGTGYDRLLDALLVTITPASATASNIEVAVRGTDKVSTFTSQDSAPPALQAVDTATLPKEGMSLKITAFLKQMTDCYALPIDQRVSVPVNNNGNATGDASAVSAPACKAVFSGEDPVAYLSNGSRVGRDASNNGSFAGLFRTGATGVKFDMGAYEFTRANGDLVISYRNVDTQGVEAFDQIVVREDNDGKLRAIGNQYQYSGGVNAYHQLRMFPTLNQSGYSYYSTGYSLNVNNETEAGQLKFDRVEVSAPDGTTLTLWPDVGYTSLNFKRADDRVSGTSFLRLATSYMATPPSSLRPQDFEPSMKFAKPAFTEEQLTQATTQGVWTFRYFLRGNTGSTSDATQTYRTRARALTLSELKQKSFAELSNQFKTEGFADAVPDLPGNGAKAGTLPMYSAADGPQPALITVDGGGDAWTVPTSAMPPTRVTLFGSWFGNTRTGFNHTTRVAPTARNATITCTPFIGGSSNGTDPCAAGSAGAYGQNAYATDLQLNGTAKDGRVFSSHYATYKLILN